MAGVEGIELLYTVLQTVTCPNCGAPALPHMACPSCGSFRGRVYREAVRSIHTK